MGDPQVVALLLGAVAGAALVARLAFWVGGRLGYAIVLGGFVVLALVNLSLEAFSDPARIASGAAIGFTVGTVVGFARFGMSDSRRTGRTGRRVR